MLTRERHLHALIDRLRQFPVVALVGARQVGKTTLAREVAGHWREALFLDLENPEHEARLADPMLALAGQRGLIVLDEIQRRPDLFPVLRVLADRSEFPARFLILGSASPDLLRQSAESLAGRVVYHTLEGFDLSEVAGQDWRRLWLRGGLPRAYLAESGEDSYRWRQAFIRTHLERDIPALGLRLAPATLRRFWTMLAHYHGQTWNGAELARAFGVTEKTVRHYLDVLSGTYMVRTLTPWYENLAKRQVKAPKVYLSDSGLLHSLLQVATEEDLLGHPKVGASWEGFALTQIVQTLGVPWEECCFWGLYSGAELDLLIQRGTQRLGFEFKFTSAPRTTRSMYSAIEQLGLERLYLVYPGETAFPLAERIEALPLLGLPTWKS